MLVIFYCIIECNYIFLYLFYSIIYIYYTETIMAPRNQSYQRFPSRLPIRNIGTSSARQQSIEKLNALDSVIELFVSDGKFICNDDEYYMRNCKAFALQVKDLVITHGYTGLSSLRDAISRNELDIGTLGSCLECYEYFTRCTCDVVNEEPLIQHNYLASPLGYTSSQNEDTITIDLTSDSDSDSECESVTESLTELNFVNLTDDKDDYNEPEDTLFKSLMNDMYNRGPIFGLPAGRTYQPTSLVRPSLVRTNRRISNSTTMFDEDDILSPFFNPLNY